LISVFRPFRAFGRLGILFSHGAAMGWYVIALQAIVVAVIEFRDGSRVSVPDSDPDSDTDPDEKTGGDAVNQLPFVLPLCGG
jgi:hypothetical protein